MATINKLFTIQKFSDNISKRLDSFRILERSKSLLQFMRPWIVIANENFDIIFDHTDKSSQIHSEYFLGGIELDSFETDTDMSSTFILSGTLRFHILNKQKLNDPLIAPLIIPGSTIYILFGHSDTTSPKDSIVVKKLVGEFDAVHNESKKESPNNDLFVKSMVFKYKTLTPTLTLETNSTISVSVELLSSPSLLLKSTSISNDSTSEIFSFIKEVEPFNMKQLLGFNIIPAIYFRFALNETLTDTKRNKYPFIDIIEQILDKVSVEEPRIIIDKGETIILTGPGIRGVTPQNKNRFQQTEFSLTKTVIQLASTEKDKLLMRFGDFITFLKSGIQRKDTSSLNYKIEVYDTINGNFLNTKVSGTILTIDERKLNSIMNDENVLDATIFLEEHIRVIIETNHLTKLEDLLFPLDFLKVEIEEGNEDQRLSLSKYIRTIINKINEFYNNTIDIEYKIQNNDVIFFETTTHNDFVRKESDRILGAEKTTILRLFEDQGIVSEHSIELKYPDNDFMGVVFSRNLNPSVNNRLILRSDVEKLARFLASTGGKEQVYAIQTFIKENKLRKEFDNEPINESLVKNPIKKQLDDDILRINVTLRPWGLRIDEFPYNNYPLERKNYFKNEYSMFTNSLIKYLYVNGKWKEVKGAKDLMRIIKSGYDRILNNPLVNLFMNTMFTGTITIPGIGNIWQYQRFLLETGIDVYDSMQGLLKKPNIPNDPVFRNVVTGVAHSVTTEGWTTTITFMKDARPPV